MMHDSGKNGNEPGFWDWLMGKLALERAAQQGGPPAYKPPAGPQNTDFLAAAAEEAARRARERGELKQAAPAKTVPPKKPGVRSDKAGKRALEVLSTK